MCKGKTKLHSGQQVDRFAWEHIFCCCDPYCGCTFVTRGEVARIITPPKVPNPDVNLPISARAAKRRENKAKREAAAAAAATASDSNPNPATPLCASSAPALAIQTHAPTTPPDPAHPAPAPPAAPHSPGTPWPSWLGTSR
ncbi:hypothetical protein [Acidovorax sp. SUPP1855]|uniref:hypothetical protein n=1 Tax=Acidovorax sp. SUPP1855 TaxID=431774 RepID=UPI0032EA52EA